MNLPAVLHALLLMPGESREEKEPILARNSSAIQKQQKKENGKEEVTLTEISNTADNKTLPHHWLFVDTQELHSM